ncbi:PAS domain S-box protein, partial [bacterium]
FAGFPVPTFSYDAMGSIYEWNRAAEVLTGIEAKDAFGRDVTDVFVNSPDFADFHREIVRVFNGDPVSGAQRRLNLGESGTRHLLCNSFPLRTVGRKISGGVTALLDVTGHVSAESKFRTLFEGGNDASLVLSRTGTILDANLQARLLLAGEGETSLAGRTIGEFVFADDRREHSMFLRRAVRREIARKEWTYTTLLGERIEADVAISGTTLEGEPAVLMQIHDLGERKRFESELRGAVAELERAQSIGQIGSWELDLQTGGFTWSQEMYRVCGWPEDLTIPNTREFVRLAHPDDQRALMEALRGAAADGVPREVSHRLVRRDGVIRYAVSQLSPLLEEDRIVGTVQDITERKLEEMRVLESESRFRAVVQSIDAGLMVVDSDLRVQMRNPSAERIMAQIQPGTTLDRLARNGYAHDREGNVVPFSELPVMIALQKGIAVRSQILSYHGPDDELIWLSVSATPVRIPGLDTVRSAVVTFTDVTVELEHEKRLQDEMELSRGLAKDLAEKNKQLRAANRRLKTLATTDGLTGLSNHRTFQEFLDAHTSQATDGVSLLMLDVDHFKGFNDTFGHRVGDEVLRDVARILGEHCRRGDMAARYGGEEFVLVLPHTDARQAQE